jgi:pectate lyase
VSRSSGLACALVVVLQACGSETPSDAEVPEWAGSAPAAPATPEGSLPAPDDTAPTAPDVDVPTTNEGNVPVGSLSPSSDGPGAADDGEGQEDEENPPAAEPAGDVTPPVAPSNPGEVLAFPGASGFGRFAVGARGRDVYHVTNLNDSGAGSLRDAISQPNRTVVFDVGGVIRLESRLVFRNNQTIAGQTAPGGGITLYGDGTSFSAASNTIVRYVRFRMGRGGESEKDTVTMANGHDVIWDHVSLSWGRDGTFDLNAESGEQLYNLTLQDSIVAQGLQTHSTGGLVATTGTSIIRSLYIDNNSRNPKARGTLQFVNNVVYNWVVSGYILGDTAGRSDGYMVGNYFITGPETNGGTLDSPTPQYNLFASGNFYDNNRNGALDGRSLGQGDFGSVTWQATPSVPFPEVPALTAQEALEYVSTHAGASIFRDAADDYVVGELRSFGARGATISDETSLGLPNGVGELPTAATPADVDRDGMADAWERASGLDPNDDSDRNGDPDGDGWTNLEEYINSLAR